MPLKHERPSQKYMRELKAVARAAVELQNYLDGTTLPNSFPVDWVNSHCDALVYLPEGTAEGSIVTLQPAEQDLNKIFYQNISLPPEEDEEPTDELLSTLLRGGELDDFLTTLTTAVRQAMECYKHESGDYIETDITAEMSEAPDLTSERFATTQDAETAENAARDTREQFDEIRDLDSAKAESYSRTLGDIQAQAKTTKGVLGNPKPQKEEVDRLANGLQRTATVLRGMGEGLKLGSGIGQDINNTWSELQRQGVNGVLEAASTVGKGLINISSRIEAFLAEEKQRKQKKYVGPFDYVEVYNRLLRGEMVPDSWAPHVTEINLFSLDEDVHHLNEKELSQISGDPESFSDTLLLSNLENLTHLNFGATSVSDISVLSYLTKLRNLSLHNTYVSDISALSNLTSLFILDLEGTSVSNIASLSGLARLALLNLNGTSVSDVSALSGLTELEFLLLSNTSVSETSVLTGLTSLVNLSLANTFVSDISELSGLAILKYLTLSETSVSDISALRELTRLAFLNLNNTSVSDISALSGLTSLENLSLSGTPVSDISALKDLNNLENLYLSGTKVKDTSVLDHLENLTIHMHE